MQSEQEFLEALKIDPNNDHAHLGLGLIEISRARALNNRASAYAVGEHLIGGLDHLARATSTNKYIGTLTQSEAWRKLLESSREFQGLGLTPDFIESAAGYRLARRAMIEGNYALALELVDSLKNVPAWLQGHVAALKTQAQLERTSDRSQALQILDQFDDQRSQIDASIWAAIYGRAAAVWAQGDPVWQEKALAALRLAVDKAHDRPSILDAMATEGTGYALLGKTEQARKIAADVEAQLVAQRDEGAKYRSVWLSLGLLFVQIGDFEQAARAFANAIGYDRNYLELIDRDRQLDRFRQWDGYRKWRLGVVPT
jgi:tetratricopeptide (TPR) repeat protein